MKNNNLHGAVTPELVAKHAELSRRLAPFSYFPDEVLELALYQGLKEVEALACSYEQEPRACIPQGGSIVAGAGR